MAFEERLRRLACDHLEAWYEVVFWKNYSLQAFRNRNTSGFAKHLEGASPSKLWESCMKFVAEGTRDSFEKFLDALGITSGGLAIPATFVSFAAPQRFPMVDIQIARWIGEHPERLRVLSPEGPSVSSPKFPGNKKKRLEMDDFDFMQSWTEWCRDTASRLSQSYREPWRARDVEMAVWAIAKSER